MSLLEVSLWTGAVSFLPWQGVHTHTLSQRSDPPPFRPTFKRRAGLIGQDSIRSARTCRSAKHLPL